MQNLSSLKELKRYKMQEKGTNGQEMVKTVKFFDWQKKHSDFF